MISEKAVEAAARAACAGVWDGLTSSTQEATLVNLRAALSAALPLLLDGKREEIADAVTLAYKTEDHIEGIADMAADRIIAMLGGGE